MDDDTKVQYWLELADYDLETAEAMLSTGRYLYVGFMCHQVVEKCLKALYTKTFSEIPPKIHSHIQLMKKIGIDNQITKSQKEFINRLDPLNIEARYPSYKNEVAITMTKDNSILILKETKEFISWIKSKL